MGAKSSKSGESRPAARDEGKFYGNVSEFWFLIDKVNPQNIFTTRLKKCYQSM